VERIDTGQMPDQPKLRVLGRVRLSHDTDESTSVERQQEIITNWADSHGHTVAGWATDIDVSRSVDPFDAPELKPWLKQKQQLGEWDVVACWKLDRLATGSIYLNKLIDFCQTHDKSIVSVTENFDLGTWVGRMIANVIAGVAEGELEAIRERTSASREKLRQVGRWGGGSPVYGLMAVRSDDGPGYTVKRDPDAFGHLRFMVDQVLAGKSLNSIAAELNRLGVLSPQDHRRRQAGKPVRGTQWRTNTITSVLTSRTLLGEMSHEGKAVRQSDGMAVEAGESAVTREEWRGLQARLVEGITPRARTETPSLLLDVAFCGEDGCGAKMYRQSANKRGKEYIYYRCSAVVLGARKCGGKSVKAGPVESKVSTFLLETIGDQEMRRRVIIPGEDHTAELEEAQGALEELVTLAGTAQSKAAQTLYRNQMSALDRRIVELEAKPRTVDTERWEGTGKTFREEWGASDVPGRRKMLMNLGVMVEVESSQSIEPLRIRVSVKQSFGGFMVYGIKGALEAEWLTPDSSE
jgi:site-specific DNA recombinase